MKLLTILISLSMISTAFAGKSDLEPKETSTPYLHAGSIKVSLTKELSVKGGAGSVKVAPAAKADLVERKSRN